MNHSIYSADRATHFKIVAVALICGTVVAGIGLASRMTAPESADGTPRIETRIPVIKAAPPVTASDNAAPTVR
jgi:hypothetical protein